MFLLLGKREKGAGALLGGFHVKHGKRRAEWSLDGPDAGQQEKPSRQQQTDCLTE